MLIKRIKSRGANIVVEANAEILVLPSGDIGRWKKALSERVKQETRKEAPTNERPRWGHYGAPLKSTFTASTTTRITKGGGFIYSAIGSRSPHAYYVDQGTGIFNGGSPWKAKILPPYTQGGASLYEHTWHPPDQPATGLARPIMIKGQKGQHFFDKGLDRAFRSVGDRRYKPIGGRLSGALRSFPEGIADFAGNTVDDGEGGAFRASLDEWRIWRDEAFNSGRVLGEGFQTREHKRRAAKRAATASNRHRRSKEARERRAERSRERSQKRRDELKAKNKTKAKPVKKSGFAAAKSAERLRFLAAAAKKYGQSNIDIGSLEFENGYWFITVKVFTKRESDGVVRPDYKEIRGRKVE